MLQHWAHSRNRPTATDEKKKSLLYILVVISLVGTISGKSFSMHIFKLKCAKFDLDTPSWI